MADLVCWGIFLGIVLKFVIPAGIAANLAKKGFGRDELDDGNEEEATPEEGQRVADKYYRRGDFTYEEYVRFSRQFGTKF